MELRIFSTNGNYHLFLDIPYRLKKDVNLMIPEKHELIVRVELSDRQKEWYRLVLTRNFEELRKKSRASSSIYNMIMQLKKVRD